MLIVVLISGYNVSDKQLWTATDRGGESVEVSYRAVTQNIGVQARGREMVYFSAPGLFT